MVTANVTFITSKHYNFYEVPIVHGIYSVGTYRVYIYYIYVYNVMDDNQGLFYRNLASFIK